MKIFCFSFIIYILVLVVQPCQETFSSVEPHVSGYGTATHLDSPSPADPASEECSPFCICSCCSHPVAARAFTFGISKESKNSPGAKTLASYTNPYRKTHQESIWQPPKD